MLGHLWGVGNSPHSCWSNCKTTAMITNLIFGWSCIRNWICLLPTSMGVKGQASDAGVWTRFNNQPYKTFFVFSFEKYGYIIIRVCYFHIMIKLPNKGGFLGCFFFSKYQPWRKVTITLDIPFFCALITYVLRHLSETSHFLQPKQHVARNRWDACRGWWPGALCCAHLCPWLQMLFCFYFPSFSSLLVLLSSELLGAVDKGN